MAKIAHGAGCAALIGVGNNIVDQQTLKAGDSERAVQKSARLPGRRHEDLGNCTLPTT